MGAVGASEPLESCEAIAQRTVGLIDAVDPGQRVSPWVTLSYAQSLDGCVSASAGTGTSISNQASRGVTHELRAIHDAILVGINTVLVDDPRLTVRLVSGPDPRPVIVDSQLKMPLDARLLDRESPAPIVATRSDSCLDKEARLVERGVEVLRLPSSSEGRVDLRALMQGLGRLGIRAVMVEGGARIISSVLAEKLADQLVLTISPMILGGVRAVEDRAGAEVPAPLLPTAKWHWADGNVLLQSALASAT